MKAISIILMLLCMAATTVFAQDAEYYSYLQKFVDQAKKLQAIRDDYGDISYKQFDKVYKDHNNIHNDFGGKYFKQTLDPNTPSYKLVQAVDNSMSECSSSLYEDELDKASYEFDSTPYSGLNKNKFWKNLDQYFADIEKLKTAIADEKTTQNKGE